MFCLWLGACNLEFRYTIRMTLHELLYEIKSLRERLNTRELYALFLVIVVGFGSFGLGRLSKLQEVRVPIRIEQASAAVLTSPPILGGDRGVVESPFTRGVAISPQSSPVKGEEVNMGGQLVASKSGSKYHFPWCSGAQRIAEANKLWFNSVEEARKAGYTPASNCMGLR